MSINECSEALFALFKPATSYSKETLIDSFEFLATICIVSGMRLDEKIQFIFNLFDFNESGKLNIKSCKKINCRKVKLRIKSPLHSILCSLEEWLHCFESFRLNLPNPL